MTLSGTHEIVAPPFVGQATSALPRRFIAVVFGGPLIVCIVLLTIGGLLRGFLANLPAPAFIAFGLFLGFTTLLEIAFLVHGRVNYHNPIVDFDTAAILIGPDRTPFEAIERAWLIDAKQPHRTDKFLFIAGTGHRVIRVILHSTKDTRLTDHDRSVLAGLVERCPIAVPSPPIDRWDPKAKFIPEGEPDYLTKERALALLAPSAIPQP